MRVYNNGQAVEGKRDRKSTRLNSSHSQISYAVFCLKKKKKRKALYTTAERHQSAGEGLGNIIAMAELAVCLDIIQRRSHSGAYSLIVLCTLPHATG